MPVPVSIQMAVWLSVVLDPRSPPPPRFDCGDLVEERVGKPGEAETGSLWPRSERQQEVCFPLCKGWTCSLEQTQTSSTSSSRTLSRRQGLARPFSFSGDSHSQNLMKHVDSCAIIAIKSVMHGCCGWLVLE
ncbi:hypothetical protein E5288_WYG001678 [Bos mutus]|uniref:Uncharacterized protein n=1 Tax=Bos mutus TaxID=72004 RepID=A0A6B0RUB8_9CETA|nr:hypothetical protein [Bos mutus]